MKEHLSKTHLTPEVLYHYTASAYLPSIIKEGLVPGRRQSPWLCPKDYVHVWLESRLYQSKIRDVGWTTIAVDTSLLDSSKLRRAPIGSGLFVYKGIIPPEALRIED